MRRFLQNHKNKIKAAAVTTGGALVAMAPGVWADGIADATVTAALTGASDNIVATMVVVASLGIAVWLAPMGFRFAKKMFRTVAS